MITGSMSAPATQPPRITQARQARRLRSTPATMTATTTATATQPSAVGGAANEYDPPGTGSHCHGPPTRPGTSELLSSPPTKFETAPAEAGVAGCVVEVC